MIWTARALAGMISRVFPDPVAQLDALAVVLATSRGDDAFRDAYGGALGGERRGLFGLDVAFWPAVDPVLWDEPGNNVAGAVELYRAAGDTFDWSPEYARGIDADTYAVARAALDDPTDGMTFGEAQRAALLHELGNNVDHGPDRAPELAAAFTVLHAAIRRGER